jgi:hypothetical protein
VILLNRSGGRASDADAVATHHHLFFLSLFVQIKGLHGLRIFGAQIKNLPDLDATKLFKNPVTARAKIA